MDVLKAIHRKDLTMLMEFFNDEDLEDEDLEFDVNATYENGWTLLHWACFELWAEGVEFLLDRGANPYSTLVNGSTPQDFLDYALDYQSFILDTKAFDKKLSKNFYKSIKN